MCYKAEKLKRKVSDNEDYFPQNIVRENLVHKLGTKYIQLYS